jgi:phenylalanyl-tRNA synthetase beta chain
MRDCGEFQRGSAIQFDVSGQRVAVLGTVGEELTKAVGLKVRPLYAELDLDLLLTLPGRDRRFVGLPRFPSVSRDLAIVLEDQISYQQLEDLLQTLALKSLVNTQLFDIYRGKQIGPGRRSLALRFVFRHDERTLTSTEVDEQMSKIIGAVESGLKAEVRKA